LSCKGYEVTTGIGPDLLTRAKVTMSEIVELLSRRCGLSPIDAYMLCSVCADLRMSAIDLGDVHRNLALPAKQLALRCGDFVDTERGRGHQVQHRLEQVEVQAVDSCHAGQHVLQRTRPVQVAEASADGQQLGSVLRSRVHVRRRTTSASLMHSSPWQRPEPCCMSRAGRLTGFTSVQAVEPCWPSPQRLTPRKC